MSGAPGTSVLVTGANFVNVREVRFNETLAIFTVISPERLAVTVPFDATSGAISVITSFGTTISVVPFVVAPRIVDFIPTNGSPGTLVSIEGVNFSGATAVTFNGRNASSFSVVGPTQIHATVPAGATSGPMRVVTPAGAAVSSNNFVVIGPEPLIIDFSPTNGTAGTVVTIEGRNFDGVTAVRFSGVNAAFFATAATQLRATVPAGAATGPISVTTAAGTGSSAKSFLISSSPIITDFSPQTGIAGTRVTIEGFNFTGATAVRFGGTNSASFSVTSPNQLTAVVPAGARTGPISVTTARGTGTSVNVFEVRAGPIIFGFSPITGPVGTPLTIEGANFANVTAVRIGTNPARFTVIGPSQINAIVPAGAVTGPVTVVTANGTGSSTNTFVVTTGAPVIFDFFPGAALAGSTVAIDGMNFTGATAVRFGGSNAAFSVTSPTQISCVVPPGAKSGPITVTTPIGSGSSTNIFIAAPAIGGFSPSNGVMGASVAIRGTNLAEVFAVRFNGAIAAFSLLSSSEITATVPLGATSGSISVANAAGIVATTNAFVVLPSSPELTVDRLPDNRIGISWPVSVTNFVLQATEALVRPAQWMPLTNVPVASGFRQTVTVDATGATKFYRLSRQ